MTNRPFATVQEAFLYCRDMDASLSERLETFSNITRALRPEMQEAVDRLVARLISGSAGKNAPKPGEAMPPFTLPDERGRLVSLEDLLTPGPWPSPSSLSVAGHGTYPFRPPNAMKRVGDSVILRWLRTCVSGG
jgi:hypothetical protein